MISLTLQGNRILASASYERKDELKAIPGARWAPEARVWHFPATPGCAEILCALDGATPSYAVACLAGSFGHAAAVLAAPELPPIPLTKTVPWAHQLRAYHYAKALPACYLAMGLGTGKSKVVVDLAVNLGWQRVLIVCPRSVVPVWPRQFAIHGGAYVQVLALDEGSVAKRRREVEAAWPSPRPLAVVINYQALIASDFRAWAARQAWDAIILDEAHHAKAAGGVTSRFLALIGPHAKRRIALSGTPMAHSPLDLYGQYRFLDPGIFGTSNARFVQRYAVMGGYQNHEVKGYQNQAEFQEKAASIMLQVGRDVLDLPEYHHVTRTATLSASARKVYDGLEKDFVAELESGTISVPSALVKLLRLQQLTGGTLQSDAGMEYAVDGSKADLLKELLEDIGSEPVVVFARFRADLASIWRAAALAGLTCLEHSGQDHEGLARWQAGEGQVLAVQIQAGGEGIDLSRAALCIYYSKGFSLGDYSQSLARLHRPGQKRAVTYYHLVIEGSVDGMVERALAARKDVVEAVMEAMATRTTKA